MVISSPSIHHAAFVEPPSHTMRAILFVIAVAKVIKILLLSQRNVTLQLKKDTFMRILIVNTSARTGGAAIAASRLRHALAERGHQVKMLVADKDAGEAEVVQAQGWVMRRLCFLWERLVVFMHLFTRRGLFDIDPAVAGSDITGTREFQEADVIHLHWVNQGLLSLGGLRRVMKSGKPVVVTMHDMWYMTGLCHYAHDCRQWQHEECRDCPLHGCGTWAHRVWQRKRKALAAAAQRKPVFVGCSEWMASLARESGLLGNCPVLSIPNTIDTNVFSPQGERLDLLPHDKNVILFAAQKVTDPRKGMSLLVEALRKVDSRDTVVAVLGGKAEMFEGKIPQKVYALGYQSDPHKIAAVYRSASIFVTPSLSDNLPNTIMEAMACGVPCVGFRVGGIPEMIDHRQNGYVATAASIDDLAAGIIDALKHRPQYSAAALRKVHEAYSHSRIAMLYEQVYLNHKTKCLL